MRGCCSVSGVTVAVTLGSTCSSCSYVLLVDTQQKCCQGAGTHFCETVRERLLLSTDSSKKKIILKALTGQDKVCKGKDNQLMIPLSPLMIGKLEQPKPDDTQTLMFQGITETGVSSVKHLWPAGSHWQRLALPLPSDIKCGRTVSSADMRFSKHKVKQQPVCKPTNHHPPSLCLCRPNVMYSLALSAVYTDQIFSWAREWRRELAESSVTVCLDKFAKSLLTSLLQ